MWAGPSGPCSPRIWNLSGRVPPALGLAGFLVAPALLLQSALQLFPSQDHDSAVLSALPTLLGTGDLPRHARDVAQLPLSLGGLGLVSAVRNSVPAFWASWADCLAVLSRLLPRVAQEFLDHLDGPDPQPAP